MIQHHERTPGDSAVGMRLHRRCSSPRKVLLHTQEGAVDALRLSVTLRGFLSPLSMHRGCTLEKGSLVYLKKKKKRSLTPEGIATLEEDLLHLSLERSVTLDKSPSHSGKHLPHTKRNLCHTEDESVMLEAESVTPKEESSVTLRKGPHHILGGT